MSIIDASEYSIRRATGCDIDALATLFAKSIRALGPQHYSPQQIDAWAASAEDKPAFTTWILDATTFVADRNHQLLGFCGIAADGHVTSLYVDEHWPRQGVGTRLLQTAIDFALQQGIDRLYAETNPFSRPLFEKLGFHLIGIEEVDRRGAHFKRHLVEMHLSNSTG